MEYRDYYKILGVSKGVTEEEIKSAYRKQVKQYHPDVNPNNKQAEEKFKEINEAYEVLSDKDKRAKYDRLGADWQNVSRASQYRRRPSRAEGLHFDFEDLKSSGYSDFFKTFFRNIGYDFDAEDYSPKGQDNYYEVVVTLDEAYFGTEKILELQENQICPTCQGRGVKGNKVCSVCYGEGMSHQSRKLQVKIPRGVQDGSKIRIGGEGQKVSRGKPGDLYLVIKIKPHHKFVKKNGDLHLETPLPFIDAILGSEIEVATLAEKVKLKIPPHTQNEQVFRLKGLGMPKVGKSVSGDLYVKVKIQMPAKITPEMKKHFEEIKKIS